MKDSVFNKRTVSLLLTVLVIISLFVGCGKGKPEGDKIASSSKMSDTVSTPDDTNSPTESSDTATSSADTSGSSHDTSSASSDQSSSEQTSASSVPSSESNATSSEASSSQGSHETMSSTPDKPEKPQSSVEAYVDAMSLEQQVAQMFFARCPSSNAVSQIKQYQPGGYILFAVDFQNQTPASVKKTISEYQQASKTPMLIGVDEEGGSVVRVSKFPAFRSSPFLSPAEIYNSEGLNGLINNTVEKDALLRSLGINVNLAPVCDVSQNPSDYIYKRTMGKDAKETAECIKTIVSQMKKDNMGTVLKHFPGYGSNVDTHTGIAVDTRTLDSFRQNDFLPFISGMNAGAGGIMINHNIINCLDSKHPATLSPAVNNVLRNELGFDGVIMTDDLSMSAITKYTDGKNAAVAAVLAGNDMLISSDFVDQYNAVLSAVRYGTISKDRIRQSVIRIVKWKIELGILSI